MTRSVRLLAVAILAVVLALSAAQNAFASTEIAYDPGGAPAASIDVNVAGGAVAVRFSLPAGWSQLTVSGARFYDSTAGSGIIKLHVESSPGVDLITPITESVSPGWNTYTLTTGPISGDFYIVAEYVSGTVGVGGTNPGVGRSYYGPPAGPWTLHAAYAYYIRAEVDPYTPASGPVGGFMEPVNKLVVFAPYLALLGVIGAVAVIYWKRPDN